MKTDERICQNCGAPWEQDSDQFGCWNCGQTTKPTQAMTDNSGKEETQNDINREFRKVRDKEESNLLPCPFCGSQPEWINEALEDSHFYIKCPECKFVMKRDRRDKVIGYWNNRHELFTLKAENENVNTMDYGYLSPLPFG